CRSRIDWEERFDPKLGDGDVACRREARARGDEREFRISTANAQGHSHVAKGWADRWPEVAARIRGKLVVQRVQCGIGRREGCPPETLEQIRAPLLEIDDPQCETFGMQTEPEDIDRRLK